MKMLPIAVPLVTPASMRGRTALAGTAAMSEGATPPVTPRDAGEPDWQSAYQRRREEEQPAEPDAVPSLLGLLPAMSAPMPLPLEAAPVAEVRAASAAPDATATTARIDAVRQLADANPAATPVARSWQVELPGTRTGTAWQLHIEQAQPQAPLNLALHVPPVAQSQARQQLSDLDKRLRDAGHDVLRPRVRAARGGKRALPSDEVTP